MGHGPAANLPGAPSTAFWNQRMTPANLLGLNPGAPSKAAGAALPPTSGGVGDNGSVPWHPDSPMFWLVVVGGATLLGVAGASLRFRAGPAHAGASLGKA